MNRIILRNKDVCRVLMGKPNSHRHLRTIIETKDTCYVFQEATIANVVRAYVNIKTHPSRKGIELIREEREEGWKRGYASNQLVETKKKDRNIIEEINRSISDL